MSDESVRRQLAYEHRGEVAPESEEAIKPRHLHYSGLSESDRRLNVEGRLLDVLSRYGGKRLVAGKVMHDLVRDLTNEYYEMKEDGLL